MLTKPTVSFRQATGVRLLLSLLMVLVESNTIKHLLQRLTVLSLVLLGVSFLLDSTHKHWQNITVNTATFGESMLSRLIEGRELLSSLPEWRSLTSTHSAAPKLFYTLHPPVNPFTPT
jgi:hypothetical protein